MKIILIALFLITLPQPLQDPKKTSRQTEKASQVTRLERKSEYQSWGCRGVDEEQPDPLFAIPPLIVSPDRLLVTVCNTLYMLDSRKNILWSWSTRGASLTDQPIIDSTGTIYVIAYDLIWVALDAESGAKKWQKDSNGRAVYSQIEHYKENQYLIVVDMSGYDHHAEVLGPSVIRDKVMLCKGEKIIWTKDFPRGAVLQVWGDRILAVKPGKEGTEITEIGH